MKKQMIGCKVRFENYESVLREWLEDERCRIDFPKEDGKSVMLPQYTQYMFCFYIGETCLCAKGQILSRYRIENREVMEIELLEGMYQREPLRLENISDNSVENLQKTMENRWISNAN